MNEEQQRMGRDNASEHHDPRMDRTFRAEWYPRADGNDAPAVDSADRQDQIRLKFLAAYYNINRSYAHLLETRRTRDIDSAEGKAAELEALRAIEVVLRERDALEDEFAPYGIIAEPISLNGFTTDLKFMLGVAHRPKLGPADFYSSTYISIPLPAGVNPEPRQHEK